ncbi:MAG: hypothetical protein ACREOE_06275 [Gemmatimonadales bacterium]
MAAGGLALLATRRLATRQLAWRGTPSRDPLSPAVTASFFLLVTALVFALNVSGVGAVTSHLDWLTPLSQGSATITAPLVPGLIVAGCLVVAVGYSVQAALRPAGARARIRCARSAVFWVRLIAAVQAVRTCESGPGLRPPALALRTRTQVSPDAADPGVRRCRCACPGGSWRWRSCSR